MESERVREILGWYPAFTDAQKKNFLSIVNAGRLAGTGKFVILPVDQGFEHGPDRSFIKNPYGYNPHYHYELAFNGGCNAYAAPLGALEAVGHFGIPTILKVNSHDLMMPDEKDALPAITSWVDDAVRLRCEAVGFSIYPGSMHAREMYQQVRELVRDARAAGLVVVIWAYPRGSGLPNKAAETAVDVVAYGVHIAAQLGAHIIKCKPTTAGPVLPSNIAKEVYKDVPLDTLAERTRIVVRAAFGGRRIVIHAGGETKDTEKLLQEVRQLKEGGSFGSIVGRNAFQRSVEEGVDLLHKIQDIYLGDVL